jgi:hypothetical protein
MAAGLAVQRRFAARSMLWACLRPCFDHKPGKAGVKSEQLSEAVGFVSERRAAVCLDFPKVVRKGVEPPLTQTTPTLRGVGQGGWYLMA